MRRIPLAVLAALALAACDRPNLDETNGGYEPGMAPAPVATGDADEAVVAPPVDHAMDEDSAAH